MTKKKVEAPRARRKWEQELELLAGHLRERPDDDARSHAAEVIHALAYALASSDEPMLRTMKTEAVSLMRERREHVGAVRDPETGRIEYGPIGFVAGGPVREVQVRTDETLMLRDRLVSEMSASERAVPAVRLGMLILARLSTTAPRLRSLVRGELMESREAVVAAVERVLMDTPPGERPTETAHRAVGAALRAMGADAKEVKDALADVRKQDRRKRRAR